MPSQVRDFALDLGGGDVVWTAPLRGGKVPGEHGGKVPGAGEAVEPRPGVVEAVVAKWRGKPVVGSML